MYRMLKPLSLSIIYPLAKYIVQTNSFQIMLQRLYSTFLQLSRHQCYHRKKIRQHVRNCSSNPPQHISDVDISSFPPDKIRNFGIIAHIDHGKSTLADRILELVGAIDKSMENKQVLDKLQVERERGITVKAQSASVLYNYYGEDFILNLIDTPVFQID